MGVKSTLKSTVPSNSREWGFTAAGGALGALVVKFGPALVGKAAGLIDSMKSKPKSRKRKAA